MADDMSTLIERYSAKWRNARAEFVGVPGVCAYRGGVDIWARDGNDATVCIRVGEDTGKILELAERLELAAWTLRSEVAKRQPELDARARDAICAQLAEAQVDEHQSQRAVAGMMAEVF